MDDPYITSDLVLIGGGHSHLFVLRQLAMNPPRGARITLVARDLHTPYSGMLPGYIAGHYSRDETHIDLLPLARQAGARVIHGEVVAIDSDARQVSIKGRPPLDYDLLSINIGSRPSIPDGGDGQHQIAVKPVDRFISSWQQLEQRLLESDGELRLAIVGGGAGGVELALSLQHRAAQLQQCRARLKVSIVTDADCLLRGHNRRVRERFERILQQRSIALHYRHAVHGYDGVNLQGDFSPPLAADAVIWVTSASPASWLRDSGLALDDEGFIRVDACLQSVSHEQVFAAGDIAAVSGYPRPKSGVFAVRQGLPLAHNLQQRLAGRALKPFKPQTRFLSLISTGDRNAVASRGRWALQGSWCWWLKDRIDRKFIRRFTELPDMQMAAAGDAEDIAPMHCGGCGSKVGSQVLETVLEQVKQSYGVDPSGGFQHADDAAMIEVPQGMQLFQSIDHFRSIVDDPYLFGRIAANHALGDLFAMGVEAHSALVLANVVYGSERKQSQDLYQLMSGVVETLKQHQTLLLGGHSGEASQMSCGLSVNGFANGDELMLKQGMRAGDSLILTKPLGSGVLFAADMRARARGDWLDAAIEQMLVSSLEAARCLHQFGASACTDITGFGLAGHLYEMLRASDCSAQLSLDQLPLLSGAAELAREGIASSLQPQNIRIRHRIVDDADFSNHAAYPMLFDPQTAGGLLASIAAVDAEACLAQLHTKGYAEARIIGRVIAAAEAGWVIRLSQF
ncbi:MAG: selenide, water dikinase SelD [Gammaproteobacteria bacterium]|nr:selenide, water dikinase SelD [Gammaproteobacteria bacterium]